MSPFLVQFSFCCDFGSTFEPGSEAYRNFSESFAYVCFLICVPLISGATRRPQRWVPRGPGTGGQGAMGAPTSPLGLSPKIEEEERRRS